MIIDDRKLFSKKELFGPMQKENLPKINSQGKQVSQQHLDERAKEEAYLHDIRLILDKRDQFGFTPELAKQYRAVLVKHGILEV